MVMRIILPKDLTFMRLLCTDADVALIAAVLPNPRRWHPDNPTPFIRKKQIKIVRYMKFVDMFPLRSAKQ